MELEWDDLKREATRRLRGLDFQDAGLVFEGRTLTLEDDREDYGETRWQTVGRLRRKLVMVVWTERAGRRRIISMRVCDARERRRFHEETS